MYFLGDRLILSTGAAPLLLAQSARKGESLEPCCDYTAGRLALSV